ncbi:MAG TPA: TetR family transcriptional regulator, partial [Lacisediminihabitans sp.]|uniref:TetR/AcrR family transcriptional regulator n=1 Tax=Lacisediminihabitans sp. TaxID=2787631 RepID=UPI002EDAC1CD
MARTDRRGGPETKDRIAQTASRLFVERGFEEVTVAEIGRAAGVSSVTVFKYFPKKEDLFFDRADEIHDLFLAAVRSHRTRAEVLDAVRALLLDLLDQQHPLSGLDERSVVFFRTVAQSPTLIARARQLAADLQYGLTRELDEAGFDDDFALVAAFLVAGYTRILIETATELLAGASGKGLAERHRARIERLL